MNELSNRTAHRQQGLTLIEMMIAVAILLTAMASVFTIYSWCTVEVRRARQRTLVALCAQQMMEKIASTPQDVWDYDGLSTGTSSSAENPVNADLQRWQACILELPRPATGRITVLDDPDTPYSNLVQTSIQYDNYGRDTTLMVSQKFPARTP